MTSIRLTLIPKLLMAFFHQELTTPYHIGAIEVILTNFQNIAHIHVLIFGSLIKHKNPEIVYMYYI